MRCREAAARGRRVTALVTAPFPVLSGATEDGVRPQLFFKGIHLCCLFFFYFGKSTQKIIAFYRPWKYLFLPFYPIFILMCHLKYGPRAYKESL